LQPGYGRGDAEAMPNLLDSSIDDDGFIPPPPPPIPHGTTGQRFAWTGLALGPIYFFIQWLTGWGIGSIGNYLAIIVMVVSFIYLLSTLRESREDDDDGAVV